MHQRNAMSPERLHIDISSGAWSQRGVTTLTLQTPTSTAVGKAPSTKPSRWRTTEFLVYGVIAVVVIPYMVYVPISLSQRKSSHLDVAVKLARVDSRFDSLASQLLRVRV